LPGLLENAWNDLKAKKKYLLLIFSLSTKNSEGVFQKFSQGFKICAKQNKPKCHAKGKYYFNFGWDFILMCK
jgi:hypothetical protein